MIERTVHGIKYKLPNDLNPFKLDLYAHLINWKWKNITKEPGINIHKGIPIEYDAILPHSVRENYPIIYEDILEMLKAHNSKFPFRMHTFFNHVASSQAANINLFLPILKSVKADEIFRKVKKDFDRVARNELDNGFRIEYWDEPFGNLNDKTKVSGTDTDIAIAYYNKEDNLCLWLIEHKLTEAEFTECGGFKSKGRKPQHDCTKCFSDILNDKNFCYYHDVRKFNYWNITGSNKSFFVNHNQYSQCPFQGGMNQLWRNQLLGLSIESDPRQRFEKVYFSVVRHPDNIHLAKTINNYKSLVDGNDKFSEHTSKEFVNAAESLNDTTLNKWIIWYKELYKL